MARPKLSHPDQPAWLRYSLRFYEFLASLKLAVILILGMAGVLAAATFVESKFGSKGVQWYIYYSWWFVVGQILLAVNIFCAAAIRYPWKRHQTGFVVTHIGLLTLLAGSAISYRGSVDTSMLIFEGNHSQTAYDLDETYIVIENIPGRPEPFVYRHHGGPFNWGDQPFRRTMYSFFDRFSVTRGWMNLLGVDSSVPPTHHEPELIYEDDKTRIEIADYYSSGIDIEIPAVELAFYNPMIKQSLETTVSVRTYIAGNSEIRFGEGYMMNTPAMRRGRILMWETDSVDDLKGFVNATPSRTVPDGGTVVAWVGDDETVDMSIDQLKRRSDGWELPDGTVVRLKSSEENDIRTITPKLLSEYPWAFGSVDDDQPITRRSFGPSVTLEVERDGKTVTETLFSRYPFLVDNVAKSLRFEFYHPEEMGRVDLVVGPGNGLVQRVWQQKPRRVVASGEVELIRMEEQNMLRSREIVETFSMGGQQADGTSATWEMTIKRFIPRQEGTVFVDTLENSEGVPNVKEFVNLDDPDSPIRIMGGRRAELLPTPAEFDKDDPGLLKRVKLRVSRKVDGDWKPEADQWVRMTPPRNWALPIIDDLVTIELDGEKAPLQVRLDPITVDVGFAMKLVNFSVSQDAGTTMASAYNSQVVQVDVRNDEKIVKLRKAVETAVDAEEKEKARNEMNAAMQTEIARRLQAFDQKMARASDLVEAWRATQNVRNDGDREDAVKDYESLFESEIEALKKDPLFPDGKPALMDFRKFIEVEAKESPGKAKREFVEKFTSSVDWLSSAEIYMNNTLDYPDLKGRTLRFFQEQFRPPEGKNPAASIFRVNRDPGRFPKYLGSMLICFGIFIMFYMRAYFFKKSPRRTGDESEASGDGATDSGLASEVGVGNSRQSATSVS